MSQITRYKTHLLTLITLALVLVFPTIAKAQPTPITSLSGIGTTGNYIITADIDASDFTTSIASFSGTLEAAINSATNMPFRITNLGVPLFATLTGTVKNLVLEDVAISGHDGNTGAIACTANSAARIYNVGILSGSVGGDGNTGGLVGLLDGTAHIVNCYSYATITGGSNVGGIVGYNNVASTQTNINSTTHILEATMVMNCMFYGSITAGTNKAPIYGGKNINNENSGGLSNFNYYCYDNLSSGINTYNCALALEEKYLNRIEFYRLLLNSNKKLAALYASTSTVTVESSQMAKWVFEPADRTITGREPYPYPILKAQGYYPSIINPDFTNAPDSTAVGPNKGGKIGTLSVTIKAPGDWTNAPTGAKLLDADGNEITTSRTITLNRTDKDYDRFNFNYDKVQLPYYNDYGTKNYTGNKVVTGWKITAITTVANDPYTTANYDYTKSYSSTPAYFDYPNYNFANRKSSQKDLYSVSGRVFSQGAYFDVPYGVTSITIEPYWGKAAYLADEYLDVVYKYGKVSNRHAYISEKVTQLGKQFSNGKITIDGSEQTVHKTISDALGTLTGSTVYDNAVVLVGNFHQDFVFPEGTKAFTLMSVDLDKDNEPDYSLVYWDNNRKKVSPIRFDFLNIPGAAQAQKPSSTGYLLNAAIFKTQGWFEITNTALMYFSQYEYENRDDCTKANAPLILLGGYIDQFVSTQGLKTHLDGKTIYIHLGSNVLINSFGLGTHGDGDKKTPHVPVSVTGGDYLGFYLTGTYNPDAAPVDDNAECYISGGRFKELAGAAQEQIGATNSATKGNVRWQIYNADITDFYGGGYNDDKPVQGNITTDIFNSNVGTFCGGPKFGNMALGKEVTTNAIGCTFGKFFGAGFGGNSYSRKKYYDKDGDMNDLWDDHEQYYYCPTCTGTNKNERGKYYDGTSTVIDPSHTGYGKKGRGVATDFDYEYFVWTSGATGGRFYIKFASFSLARCNNVESKLKNCIINENFYGGGELGTVTGAVTSELEDCTVKGNVFGAGFSATLPNIPVRSAGFTTYPKFNKNSGMFEPGVLSATEDFEWMHKDITDYPENGTIGFLNDNGIYDANGHHVVTDVVIDNTNLGSVQTATLTLKGNTIVGDGTPGTGNVFGGGQMSAVNGNAVVKLQDETQVKGNIFGGGDQGSVVGNTTVILEEGTHVFGNVYGGGNNGPVGGNSEVKIQNQSKK